MTDQTWIERDVPVGVRLALGDLVLAAADLERYAYDIAAVFRISAPERQPAKRIVGLIQARVGELGTPPWASVSREALLAWCLEARDVLTERDRHIHASMTFMRNDDSSGWYPARATIRDGAEVEMDVEYLRDLVMRLLDARNSALQIFRRRLTFPPSPSHSYYRIPDYVPIDGQTRTSNDELNPDWTAWIGRAGATYSHAAHERSRVAR
ncbi:hypothetical protein ACFWGP_06865 [Agromyces sp. NPDC127015]|uniref:hypothetical protein n=1 Tax=Agromyces sp. NPDC127015 TaxID=3347108 RepID=UPI00364E5E21